MNSLEVMEKLKKKGVFNISDLERIFLKNRGYFKLFLNRLKKKGLIKQVTKNVYTTRENVYSIASNIIFPSYLSFLTASNFLGYTEQIPNTLQIATTRKSKTIVFQNYTIKFIPIKDFFGYQKINTDDGEIFIAEPEKLLIDCFSRPKEMGNFDEIEKVFKNSEISQEKIIKYLKKTNSQSLIKRVGFMLEQTKKIDISNEVKIVDNYVLLNPFSKKFKIKDKKWKIKR